MMPPWPGQQAAHVLDAEVALDHRLAEVAEGGGDHDGQAEQQRPATRLAVEQQSAAATAPPTAQNSADPAKPSQDFFGLTVGAIGCLPNSTPAA